MSKRMPNVGVRSFSRHDHVPVPLNHCVLGEQGRVQTLFPQVLRSVHPARCHKPWSSTADAREASSEIRQSGADKAFREIQRLPDASHTLGIPEKTLRDIRLYAEERLSARGTILPGNGFAKAFLKLGRAVYLDVPMFLSIWRAQQVKEVIR